METSLDLSDVYLSCILETFLVEWKLFWMFGFAFAVRPLETFLVEWKHIRYPRPPLGIRILETFLVEWKRGHLADGDDELIEP